MTWRVVATNALLILRALLAMPLRATGWVFVAIGACGAGGARLFALLADTVEGA